MSDALVSSALAYYARHGAALFPIPHGQKNPTGIVASFMHDFSRDPAQWAAWATSNPGCNWGVVAFASNWIIVDTDTTTPAGRDAAWQARCELFASWGIPADAMPHVSSARGGFHDYFQVPEGVDAAALRQPDAVKGLINLRCRGFTVAAGSYYDGTAKGEESGHYRLYSDNPPHLATPTLVAYCTRAERVASAAKVGQWDFEDVIKLYAWMAERGGFDAYEDWIAAGMVARTEFGERGLELWQIAHDSTVDGDTENSKWLSFSDDAGAGVALGSILARAYKMGWRGKIQKSLESTFGTVAALAQQAGATLASAGPLPMMAGQQALTDIGLPILTDFLANTTDLPLRPANPDAPTLSDACSGHGLFEPLRESIDRILGAADSPKAFKNARFIDVLALLSLVHQDTFDSVCRRIKMLGCSLAESKIKLAAATLAERVERAFVKNDGWQIDVRTGFPENDNSDNVAVFLGIIDCEVRWNGWLERAEIRGGSDPHVRWTDWTYIDDTVAAKLRTRGNRTKTRFRPGKDFFWESLLAIAHQHPHDPVLEMLDQLAAAWDGVPRLATWLSQACGVSCDLYHQAVGRNIVGGIVTRARDPGCKHDTMPVFYGPQGTGKSTLARILALRDEWFTDAVLLGDASKELVLSLAGKLTVEISEMGMHGTANASHVKKMVSAQFDEGRTAYARAVTKRPRRNVFVGTTNDDEPLTDPSGNRRFLPVHVTQEIDLVWLRANVGQLIGEAARRQTAGESFDLPRSVWGLAADRQESARAMSDVEVLLTDWFAPNEMAGPVTYVIANDLLHLEKLAGLRFATKQRGGIMRKLGFRQEKPMIGGKRTQVWVRGHMHITADIPRLGTRYMVGEVNGRPVVRIVAPAS